MSEDYAKHLTDAEASFCKVVDFGMRVSLEPNGKPATEQCCRPRLIGHRSGISTSCDELAG